MDYQSIYIQGNIVSTEILDRIRTEDIKHQQAVDFGLEPKASVRDEIGVAWSAARAHYVAFRMRADRLKEGESGASETRASWVVPLLQQLGYTVEKAQTFIHPDTNKSYAISHRASNLGGFPIHIMGVNDDLDKRRENGGPRLSPHALVQEYLNNDEHDYALVTNGNFLRLLRDATRLVRLSYLEFDLKKMMEEELYSDFAVMFRLLHATRMPKQPDAIEDSFIDFYHQESLASGSRIRERLSSAVEGSIKVLANGFLQHPDNDQLRDAIRSKRLTSDKYYQLQLRLIYRFLFLIVTEERNLVYPETRDPDIQFKRKIYYDYYSIERLRELALKIHYVDRRKYDLWEGVKSTFLLFEQGQYGEKLGIRPLGSGLFGPNALELLRECRLDNNTLLTVVRHLTLFENDQKLLVRVNYSDLDVEEFGSVYEGLLEYDAVIHDEAGQLLFAFVLGSGRSSSGSHYTPEELVKPLIKHSLDYIIEDKLKESDKEKALLSIKVCDVACGSGHILLSAARRIAIELARVRTKEDQPTPPAMRAATRDAIKGCIYGVDKNPLAVELCKVALWLEAHNPGEPLNFLDHHIKCGDSIVGLAHKEELANGIADEAFKTLPGDDKEIAAAFRKQNKKERESRQQRALQFDKVVNQHVMDVLKNFEQFDLMPEGTPQEIADKEIAYRKLTGGIHWLRLQELADLQLAQFFIPKSKEKQKLLATDGIYYSYLRGESLSVDARIMGEARSESIQRHFFHWFLEFPEVSSKGGFDVVLSNPPYLGGKKISGTYGLQFISILHHSYVGVGGQSDLLAYFVRRIWSMLRKPGFFAIIATNSIREGDTREGSIEHIERGSGVIVYAQRSIKWPGNAKLFVTLVAMANSPFDRDKFLDGRRVSRISPLLEDDDVVGSPSRLNQEFPSMYRGVDYGCDGFVLSRDEVVSLLRKDRKNIKVISYLQNGDDTNSSPNQSPSRYILNFRDLEQAEAECYSEAYELALLRVKPMRLDDQGFQKWWQYHRRRGDLYEELAQASKCIVTAFTTRHLSFSFVSPKRVYTNALNIIPSDDTVLFAILHSTLHSCWAWKYASRLKNDLRYTPTDCYSTFPFPSLSPENDIELMAIGQLYQRERKSFMVAYQLGLTDTYNLFHASKLVEIASLDEDTAQSTFEKSFGKEALYLRKHLLKTPGVCSFNEAVAGIEKLRKLHVKLDQTVLEAYGWRDIKLRHDFYEVDYLPEDDRVRFTIHPDARREVLKRLLELNHKIHAEEVAQQAANPSSAKPKPKPRKPKPDNGTDTLPGEGF